MSAPADRGAARPRRRRDGGDELVVIYWRDIPAQVNAGRRDAKVQRILPRRFQRAIDNAAMVAGRTEASQYVAEWRRVARRADGAGAEEAALAVAAELEAQFDRGRLETFVATGGWDPERPPPEDTDAAGQEVGP